MSEVEERFEREVRDAFSAHADAAPVSADAWDRIERRIVLRRPWHRSRTALLGGVVALGGAAAAAIAVIAFSGPPTRLTEIESPPAASTLTTPDPTVTNGDTVAPSGEAVPAAAVSPITGVVGATPGGRVFADEQTDFVVEGDVLQISGAHTQRDGLIFAAAFENPACAYVHHVPVGLGDGAVIAGAIAAGETLMATGSRFVEPLGQPGLIVVQGIDDGGQPTCGFAAGQQLAVIEWGSRQTVVTFPFWSGPGFVSGLSANPNGSDLLISVCDADCATIVASFADTRFEFSAPAPHQGEIFGVAHVGVVGIMGRLRPDGGAVIETLDGELVLDLGTDSFRSMVGDAGGRSTLLTRTDGTVVEIDWRSGIENPVVDDLTIAPVAAVGYVYQPIGGEPMDDIPTDDDQRNAPERRVDAALETMRGVTSFGEASTGGSFANRWFTWEGGEIQVVADVAGGVARRPDGLIDPVARVSGAVRTITANTGDGPTFTMFSCADPALVGLEFQLYRIDPQGVVVPDSAVDGFIEALGCTPPFGRELDDLEAVGIDPALDGLELLGVWWALADWCFDPLGMRSLGPCYDSTARWLADIGFRDPREITTADWTGAVLGPEVEPYNTMAGILGIPAAAPFGVDDRPPIVAECVPSCQRTIP